MGSISGLRFAMRTSWRDFEGAKEENPMSTKRLTNRAIAIVTLLVAITAASTHLRADSGTCSGQMITVPFTDVAGSPFFCSIAEAYFSGLTNGTSSTTYSPSQNVPREQMAAFITRTQDSALRRGSRRAALDQWTQGTFASGAMTDTDHLPVLVKSDGEDLWVANLSGTVSQVHASNGKLLGTWTGADLAFGVAVARGRVFVTGQTSPGKLYRIDPKQAPGAVTVVTSAISGTPHGITADESFIWVANYNSSISRINPINGTVTTFTPAGLNITQGILYDGSNIWVTNEGNGTLKKLDSDGNVLQTIVVDQEPEFPIFDGTNIWVPNRISNSVTVVRVKDSQGNPLAQAFVLATLTGNGLNEPYCAAFDGQRILVTNFSGDSVSLWKATDLTPLGSFSAPSGSSPFGACSDGIDFWITLSGTDKLARF
jgi:hypothetical protein